MICPNGRVNILDPQTPNQFDLMDKIPNKSNFSSYTDALNSNMENTNLSNAYFSAQNIQILQNGIKKGVYEKTKKNIDVQDEIELKIIMRSIYLQGCINSTQNITQQIEALNKIVIDYCVNSISSELIGYYKYREDASTLVVPQDLPIQIHKDKTLELKRWF
tara:strand:+ start:26 stop:511 length:486 start_codon:yes stop_codon:yes gene_type:complete